MLDPRGTSTFERTGDRPRRPPPRRRRRLVAAAVAIVAAFVLGLVLGDALGDRPQRAKLVSVDRGVDVVTVTQTVARETRTLVVPATSP